MKILNLTKYALTVTMGATMLAACSSNGGSPVAPSGAWSGMPGIAQSVVGPQPAKRKRAGPYQYLSGFSNSTLVEYDYPKGDAPIGSISGVSEAQGECTNVLYGTGKKTFWVTASGSNAVEEFKVGGSSPIKILSTSAGTPVGCAIDPSTGNLVATMINNGQVLLWKNARGTGTALQTPLVEAFYAGFDKGGNLYVDGFNSDDAFGFVELPKGTSMWETLSTSNSVEFPGSIQFDGKYITVSDQAAPDIFGYTCSGTQCTLKRTVALTGACGGQTWIAKTVVFCGVEVYKYPAGGSPIATLKGSVEALGAVQVAS